MEGPRSYCQQAGELRSPPDQPDFEVQAQSPSAHCSQFINHGRRGRRTSEQLSRGQVDTGVVTGICDPLSCLPRSLLSSPLAIQTHIHVNSHPCKLTSHIHSHHIRKHGVLAMAHVSWAISYQLRVSRDQCYTDRIFPYGMPTQDDHLMNGSFWSLKLQECKTNCEISISGNGGPPLSVDLETTLKI